MKSISSIIQFFITPFRYCKTITHYLRPLSGVEGNGGNTQFKEFSIIKGSTLSGGNFVNDPVQYNVRTGLVSTICGVKRKDDISKIALQYPQCIVGPKYSVLNPKSAIIVVEQFSHLMIFSKFYP